MPRETNFLAFSRGESSETSILQRQDMFPSWETTTKSPVAVEKSGATLSLSKGIAIFMIGAASLAVRMSNQRTILVHRKGSPKNLWISGTRPHDWRPRRRKRCLF